MSCPASEKAQLTAAAMPVADKSKERRHKKSKEASTECGHHHHHRAHEKKKGKSAANADASTSLPITLSEPPKHRGTKADEDDEDWEANRAAVERLCSQYPNNVCADCGETGTRWTSVNHGVFVCIRCSGVHRSLGVHISKVKSTNMDRWSLAEVRLMEAIGNAKAKTLYEARLPTGARPSGGADAAADDAVRSFIQRKYEQREFAMHNLKDVLGRLYKDTGYGRPKMGSKPGAAAEGTVTSPTRGSSSDAVPIDRAVATGKRGDTMRALYGDAAAEMQRGSSRRKDAARLSAASAPKPTYGTFGMVNVPVEEYEARWQRTLAVFSSVEALPAAAAAPAGEMLSADERGKEGDATTATPLTDPNDTVAERPQMGGAEATPAAASATSFVV
ncbi:conserved hypothetical protein [Leishmania infantum JPCM5]|uniref:Putative_GTPase_activating_protein_for_Arf_-_putative n=2 Tax=Leishmania infantum TaxID=5671 RepID=A0A6L0XIM0_LEIIN|nr:conserved hypothetical protein [Leishmania infantum JPCM5]CAC9506964.1 Putative_GTPase_activating_protein_for_Arf_-_putative [Leishmania infantum]CAM69593.1 conserved hypothetical protein [Leishmania infantum JPCM5]SUZ43532.1 Putative_GTPase_activating_protein_for_Arf_-_putative [Leishmania infantum]|eukprot:XP_001466554.1 conserved hypothetical protein [Leishmania infantum JPCM5]